jgi:hypothetical protein
MTVILSALGTDTGQRTERTMITMSPDRTRLCVLTSNIKTLGQSIGAVASLLVERAYYTVRNQSQGSLTRLLEQACWRSDMEAGVESRTHH